MEGALRRAHRARPWHHRHVLNTLDTITALDPAQAQLVQDTTPGFRRSRLWVETVRRKTPVPLHEPGLTVAQHMLLDPMEYQRQAVARALNASRLRPRLLIADAVGLGKTLEIEMTLAELQRRGRADRVLVVTPRHVLEQMQFELWTRFAIPLVRLDSDGIASVRQQLPASRNPFTYYPKIIVSIDTLKSARYRAHLEKHRWDVVVIDEAHSLARSSTLNSQLARTIAPNTEALLLASATPHNGYPESFVNLVNLLDPMAIVDRARYELRDIKHLFIRRHRSSPEVDREVGTTWAKRPVPQVVPVPAAAAEDARGHPRHRTPGLHPAAPRPPHAGPAARRARGPAHAAVVRVQRRPPGVQPRRSSAARPVPLHHDVPRDVRCDAARAHQRNPGAAAHHSPGPRRPAVRLRHRLRPAGCAADRDRVRRRPRPTGPGRVCRPRTRHPARRPRCAAGDGPGAVPVRVRRNEFQAVQFLPAVVLPQLLLCGLFAARDAMATPLQWLADVFPLTYAVDGMQELTRSSSLSGHLARDLAVVAGASLLALSLGAATLRRRSA